MNGLADRKLVIRPGASGRHYWRDLWEYRELFYVLTWRDISVRFKQTAIGVAWAVLRPLLTMVVFTLLFGRLAGLPSDGDAPYAIMVYAAMLPWLFFANSLLESSNSLVSNANLITKIYFPRMIVPVSALMTNLVDFVIAFAVLVALMVYYSFAPGWQILMLPVFLLLAFMAALGCGLFLTALNVRFRDFRFVVPFVVQLGLYVSPVGFSSSVIPEEYRLLYSLNPMVGVIDGFRWSILGGEAEIYWPGFVLSLGIIFLLLFTGIIAFRRMERSFADVI